MSALPCLLADPLPWLLEAAQPGVRYLALRDLCDLAPTDPQLVAARGEAHRSGRIAEILDKMDPAGFWAEPGPGYNPKYFSTVWSVILLAQLGADAGEDERIARACTYLLDHTLCPGGQFSAGGTPSSTADCLQGNLCWALPELGCTDARLDAAFDWLARSVTGEGIAPLEERNAPVRYYAGKCGPTFACGSNNKMPCAWGAAKVMLALAHRPAAQRTPAMQRAIEHGVNFLFSTDPALAEYPNGYSSKPSGNWWKFGFPVFYVTDILQIVEALVLLGFGDDPRLSHALDVVCQKQDKSGLWPLEYDYSGKTWVEFGAKKQPNPWVTIRALRVLKAAGRYSPGSLPVERVSAS